MANKKKKKKRKNYQKKNNHCINKNSKNKKVSSKKKNDVVLEIDKTSNEIQDKIDTLNDEHKYNQRYKNHNIFFWSLIIYLFAFAFVFFNFFLMPNLSLEGKSIVTVDYGSQYQDAGYSAFYQGKDITDKVYISGRVDTKKIGIYKIFYKIKYGSFKKQVMRKVIVKDISSPKIHFSDGNNFIYVCPGKKYKVAKYQAIDNYDGDITKKVQVKNDKNYVLYKVKDQAGNITKIKRKIKYMDQEKPTITLLGGNNLTAFLGDSFEDPGYKVIDNCDGDLTSSVLVSNSINTQKIGEAEIKYSVSDKAGNKSSVIRKVKVVERDQNGSVYLTFDDGPKEGTTNIILDILKEEGVKATFFVTNSGPDELIKREKEEGHTVALHTSSHNYAYVYSSVDDYFNDLNSVYERVKRITGQDTKYIRFPGGSSNTISKRYSVGIMSTLTKEVVNRGFKYYDWNLSSGDAELGEHTASEIYHNVVDHLSKDKVNMVLFHDIKPYTRDALRDIIKYCKENEYTLEAISDKTEMVRQKVNN